MEKIRVAVLFGGPSGEYEVSLASAAAVMRHIPRDRYDLYKIAVDRNGEFRLFRGGVHAVETDKFGDDPRFLSPLVPQKGGFLLPGDSAVTIRPDVIFPVLHGTFGEDGRLQGILDYIGIPYVGCGVMSSAVAMDKILTKRILSSSGVPVVPFVEVTGDHRDAAASVLGYPLFMKPSAGGSSLGASVVLSPEGLDAAYRAACVYGTRVLAERYVKGREIEVAVTDTENGPVASRPGEVIPCATFYDYDDKYKNGTAKTVFPADVGEITEKRCRSIALSVFRLLGCRGLARVDFFLTEHALYFNEINTLPGFTGISLYPRMACDALGCDADALVAHLLSFAEAHP